MNNILSESLTPVEEICEKERLELIDSILNTMNPIDKKVIVERIFKEYTWKKISFKFPRQIFELKLWREVIWNKYSFSDFGSNVIGKIAKTDWGLRFKYGTELPASLSLIN